MSEFLDIFTHGRRLQGAVKELSVEELETVADKLATIIERRKEQILLDQKQAEEKKLKLEAIKKQMEEAGLDISDLQEVSAEKPKRKTGQKRPVKYKITVDGEEHAWTGIGRMPRVFKDVVDSGKSLEQYAI